VTPFSLEKDSDFSRMLMPCSYTLICRQQDPLKCRYTAKNLSVTNPENSSIHIYSLENLNYQFKQIFVTRETIYKLHGPKRHHCCNLQTKVKPEAKAIYKLSRPFWKSSWIVWANYCCCVILCGPTTVVASYCVGQLLLLRHIVWASYCCCVIL